MYPLITIAGHKIGTYALFGIIGILVSATFATLKLKKVNIPSEDVIIYTLICVFGALIGGHLLYGLVNFSLLKNAFITLILKKDFNKFISELIIALGGSVYYGAFFGIIIALWCIFKKSKSKNVIFDVVAMAVPLFHVFGRLGCFFGGCCYGIESKIGFIVYHNIITPDVCGVRRFPVALLESLLNLIIFFVLTKIYNSGKYKGKLLCYYGILYSFIRFMMEFLRGDKVRGIYWGLSTSSWISIGLFIISSVILLKKIE